MFARWGQPTGQPREYMPSPCTKVATNFRPGNSMMQAYQEWNRVMSMKQRDHESLLPQEKEQSEIGFGLSIVDEHGICLLLQASFVVSLQSLR